MLTMLNNNGNGYTRCLRRRIGNKPGVGFMVLGEVLFFKFLAILGFPAADQLCRSSLAADGILFQFDTTRSPLQSVDRFPQPSLDNIHGLRIDGQSSRNHRLYVLNFDAIRCFHASDNLGLVEGSVIGYGRGQNQHLQGRCQVKPLTDGHIQGLALLPGFSNTSFFPF